MQRTFVTIYKVNIPQTKLLGAILLYISYSSHTKVIS